MIKNSLIIAAVFVVILIAILIYKGSRERKYTEFAHPSKSYTATITYYTYLTWIPMMPGQGSDKSGFLSIFKDEKLKCKVKIEMLWDAKDKFNWFENGVKLGSQIIWDSSKNICKPFEWG